MLKPKPTAPSPTDRVLVGCHEREINAAAARPPIRDADGYRFALPWRAKKLPATAEPVPRQKPSTRTEIAVVLVQQVEDTKRNRGLDPVLGQDIAGRFP